MPVAALGKWGVASLRGKDLPEKFWVFHWGQIRMTWSDRMITINIICDHGIFRQVLMALRNDSDKIIFSQPKFCKTNAILLLSVFSYKSPRTFTCGDLPQDFRNVPTHARGSRWGGGALQISCSIIFLYKCSSSAKFIWFGLVVWFLVFTRFL